MSLAVLVVRQVGLDLRLALALRPLEAVDFDVLGHLQVIGLPVLRDKLFAHGVFLKSKLFLCLDKRSFRLWLDLREQLSERDFGLDFFGFMRHIQFIVLWANRHALIVRSVQVACCLVSKLFSTLRLHHSGL